jgi:hypothetical protein
VIVERFWSACKIAEFRFEIGEGFIIDYDRGTTPSEGTSIEDWVIDLFFFVFPKAGCYA